MKLTPEGKIFYQYVAAGCAQFFKAEDNLNNLISLENGTIYISATETALHCYLFEAVRDFNIQYPNVHFKILNNSTTDSVNEILIGGSRFAELKGRKTSLEELSAYPWISLTSEAISRRFLNEYFSKNGLQFSPDVELATTDMILPAVRYNMGIGFLPEEFAGDDLESGKVFEIDVNETLPERSIILIHDTEYPQSIASKAFQKFLAERKEQNR